MSKANNPVNPETGCTEMEGRFAVHWAATDNKVESYRMAGYAQVYTANAANRKLGRVGQPIDPRWLKTRAGDIAAMPHVIALRKKIIKDAALKAAFTIEENNRDIRIIKDSDPAELLEKVGDDWGFRHIAEMPEHVRKAIKKFKLGPDSRPTEIEFWDKPGAVMKVVDILQRVKQLVEISRDDDERLRALSEALSENDVDPTLGEAIIRSYARIISAL